jgi:hypothetical protein
MCEHLGQRIRDPPMSIIEKQHEHADRPASSINQWAPSHNATTIAVGRDRI